MSKEKQSASGGGWFLTVLGLIFITLKLAEIGPVAKWSWWYVTMPLWGGFVLFIGMLLIWLTVVVIKTAVTGKPYKRNKNYIQQSGRVTRFKRNEETGRPERM